MRPHRQQPTRLPRPWDSPGKNTGVGCHFLLQCMKVKSQSEVAELCPTLSDPMDCSLPGSSIHRICQARVLEWGAIASSYVSFFLSTNACLGIFNSVWNVVWEFSSGFTWFPESGFSPGRANVWFPLCFPPVLVECVDADSLHLQFVDKMLVKWIKFSVSREGNSSDCLFGLFILLVWMQIVCLWF